MFVPLYGDMQIAPYQYIIKTPNFESSKWPCCESGTASPQSNMLPSLGAIRSDHMQYISQLAKVNNEVSRPWSRLGLMLPSLGAIRSDRMQYISQLAKVNNEVSRPRSGFGLML